MWTSVKGVCLASGFALLSGGCSISQIHATYGASAPNIVNVGCGAIVEVYENAPKKAVMVRLNAPAEVSGLVCFPTRTALSRKAAQTYFAEAKRPQCQVGEGSELSAWHHEFSYAC